jgi:cytochrome c oxidase subunit 2
MTLSNHLPGLLAQSGLVPRGTRVFVFNRIFVVFLILGTLVGVVVIAYMLYNAYKYRDTGEDDDGVDRPTLGELPSGGGKGKKLFTSFTLSAIIVISLVAWTYGTLLYVESGPPQEESLQIDVEGYQFGWRFTYPNGHTVDSAAGDAFRIPQGQAIRMSITSADVFHNFGIPAMKVKSDAIPGQTSDTWFIADETGTYTANCYELCGAGHSYMTAQVVVMEPDEYREWYAGTNATEGENTTTTATATTTTTPGAGTNTSTSTNASSS